MHSRMLKINDPFAKKVLEGLSPEFVYEVESSANRPFDYYTEFKKNLLSHPRYEEIKENYFLDDETCSFVRMLSKVPVTEVQDIDETLRDFYPICNKDEIARIGDPKNNHDYLLQFRAESIHSSARLKRVFSRLRANNIQQWNFTMYFHSDLFNEYLQTLAPQCKAICEETAYGFAHINSANGFLMKCPTGNIVIISDGLKHFLYYMNLYFYGEYYDFREDAKLEALVLAIRTMLGTETFDFELDPRSDLIPENLHQHIMKMTTSQLSFVIGHEFAHHYLNHLGKIVSVKSVKESSSLTSKIKFHSYQHQQEFDADYHSIKAPLISDDQRDDLAKGAVNFFLYLEIYNAVHDYISPPSGIPSSHPEPFDRIRNIMAKFPELFEAEMIDVEESMALMTSIKESLIKHYLPFNIDQLERYGSVYCTFR